MIKVILLRNNCHLKVMNFKKLRKYYIHFRWSKKIFLDFRKWWRFFAKIIWYPLCKVQLYFASAYSMQNILQTKTLQICLALNYDLNFPPLVKKSPQKTKILPCKMSFRLDLSSRDDITLFSFYLAPYGFS